MKHLVEVIDGPSKQAEVKVYLTERTIDGQRYGEEICAKSFDEASALAALTGATVLGERITVACMVCGNEIVSAVEADSKADKKEVVH
jgi:hypothetical protein